LRKIFFDMLQTLLDLIDAGRTSLFVHVEHAFD